MRVLRFDMSILSPHEIEPAREILLEKEKVFFSSFFGNLYRTDMFGYRFINNTLVPFDVFYSKWDDRYFFIKFYDLNRNLNVELCFDSIDSLRNKIKEVM